MQKVKVSQIGKGFLYFCGGVLILSIASYVYKAEPHDDLCISFETETHDVSSTSLGIGSKDCIPKPQSK